MSIMLRPLENVPDSHVLAHDVAELSVEICLGGSGDPQDLLRRSARSLAHQASRGSASLVILAQPSSGEFRWKPMMYACSDKNLEVQSLSMLSICNEADVSSPASPDSNHRCYRRNDVTPDHEWFNSQSMKTRQAAGLFDFTRASISFEEEEKKHRFIVELAGRDCDWRPSKYDLDLTCAVSDIMRAAYTERILRPGHARQQLLDRLTPAQRQVAMLLTEGISELEIAQIVRRSPHTVHDHIKAIFRNWDVHSRAEAISLWRHPFESMKTQ